MISPIDTRILTARPDHLTARTEDERGADALLRAGRAARLARLADWLARRFARVVSSRA